MIAFCAFNTKRMKTEFKPRWSLALSLSSPNGQTFAMRARDKGKVATPERLAVVVNQLESDSANAPTNCKKLSCHW